MKNVLTALAVILLLNLSCSNDDDVSRPDPNPIDTTDPGDTVTLTPMEYITLDDWYLNGSWTKDDGELEWTNLTGNIQECVKDNRIEFFESNPNLYFSIDDGLDCSPTFEDTAILWWRFSLNLDSLILFDTADLEPYQYINVLNKDSFLLTSYVTEGKPIPSETRILFTHVPLD